MIIRDASDWSRMSYEQAVHWLIQCKNTAWLETGKPTVQASAISDLFKTPVEKLAQDMRDVLAANREPQQ